MAHRPKPKGSGTDLTRYNKEHVAIKNKNKKKKLSWTERLDANRTAWENKKKTSKDSTEGPRDDKDERLKQISQLKKIKINQGDNKTNKEAPTRQVSQNETKIQKEGKEKKKELTAAEKETKDRSDWLKRTANSPAAKAWGNSKEANEKRWQLQKKHRAWLANRRNKKPDEDKNKNGKH